MRRCEKVSCAVEVRRVGQVVGIVERRWQHRHHRLAPAQVDTHPSRLWVWRSSARHMACHTDPRDATTARLAPCLAAAPGSARRSERQHGRAMEEEENEEGPHLSTTRAIRHLVSSDFAIPAN